MTPDTETQEQAETEAQQVVEPPRDETELLLPEPSTCVLSSGHTVKVLPLKARQFFKLLRVITRGAAPLLVNLDAKRLTSTPEQFATDVLALVVFAIPEAPELALEFVQSMIEVPTKEDGKPDLEVVRLLEDPEIEDVFSIIEVVILASKEDLAGLGKRLAGLFAVAEKTGQLKEAQQAVSSAPSPEPLT